MFAERCFARYGGCVQILRHFVPQDDKCKPRVNKKTIMSNERSNVAPKFRPHLFWREMEEVVGALKTKSCLSEASSFCLAETAEGIAKKVQPAVFLFVSVFLSAARKKNERPVRPKHKSFIE